MKKQNNPGSDLSILRQKAEMQLKMKVPKTASRLSEGEALKLIHELEVHQIELEMQNEELELARSAAQVAADKYTELYDFAPLGYFTLSSKGEIIELNLPGSRMLGNDRSLLKKSLFSFFVSNDTKPIFNHFLKKVFNSKSKETCEVVLSVKNNLPMYVHLAGNITENRKQCIVTLTDITGRKQAEESLAALALRNHILFQTASDGIHVIDDQGHVLEANAAFCTMLGYTREELLHLNVADWDTQWSGEKLLSKVSELFTHPAIFETQHRRKDGTLLDVEINAVSVTLVGRNYLYASARDITDRKRAEELLIKSETRFRSILNASPVPMALNDEQQHITFLNPAFVQTFGYTQEDIPTLADWWIKAYPDPEYRQLVADTWQAGLEQAKRTGEAFSPREITVSCKNGTSKTMLASAASFSNSFEGNHLVVLYDITERKQAVEALRESEAKYKELSKQLEAILDHIPGLVFYKDRKNNFIRVNKNVAQAHGKEKEELEGKNLSDLYPKENAIKYFQDDLAVINSGIAKLHIEEPWETAEGLKWVSTSKIPFVGNNGEFIGIIGMSIDITERKRIEEELAREQYLMRTLMDNLPDHIYFKDLESRFVRINKSLAHLFGLDDPERAIGKSDFDFFSGEHAQQAYQDEQTIIRTGQLLSIEEKETYHDRPDEWVSTIKMPLCNKEGKIIGTFGISRDITKQQSAKEEIKLKNEELQQLNAEKDKFFSIIAHDLRSPFSSFLGYTEMMAEELDNMSLKEIQSMAVEMKKSAYNLYHLLENLLEWSRIERGITGFDPKSFLLMPNIAESMQSVLESANKKGIETSFHIPENMTVLADENMLKSTIRNLTTNAVKFTSKGGKITLAAKSVDDNFVEISIRDTGIGMNKDLVDKLFHLDEHTSRPGTKGEPSSGLGLLLCKEFVEKHGGKLWVESEEGKGSTFYFTIPGNAPAI